MALFQWGSFKSAAGLHLAWKIDCDALTESDWHCIARIAADNLQPFGSVFGVPHGGLPLAEALRPYASRTTDVTRILIVDDVWTTGISMLTMAQKLQPTGGWSGFALFARGPLIPNVTALMQVTL